ncbi:hypothetical protein FNV43_RR13852 [Rhamnella rubrinervis]|uniref:protochlorophyllide reductase n=1 Tax=Rhamnella rubrinervis TaxID=2594499 RepID=A0A8K0H1W8_9ROSA|nr:hypothetical protein FNV43_RR13852 [Rhamnella rubrinervis]
MALQSASLLHPSLTLHKEGKSNASFMDMGFFGIQVPDHLKAECKSSLNVRRRDLPVGSIRAQTATTSPAIDQSAPEGKRTLRKGNVIITGASSGLGLATAKALAQRGQWHVTMAYNFRRSGGPLDVLVCNAVVYLPTAKEPSFTAEGFELSVGTNHLGHFLLSRLLLDDMKQSDFPSKRLIIAGSITEANKGTRVRPLLKTSYPKKPVIQRKHGDYGKSVSS